MLLGFGGLGFTAYRSSRKTLWGYDIHTSLRGEFTGLAARRAPSLLPLREKVSPKATDEGSALPLQVERHACSYPRGPLDPGASRRTPHPAGCRRPPSPAREEGGTRARRNVKSHSLLGAGPGGGRDPPTTAVDFMIRQRFGRAPSGKASRDPPRSRYAQAESNVTATTPGGDAIASPARADCP